VFRVSPDGVPGARPGIIARQIVAMVLVAALPQIALFLPQQVMGADGRAEPRRRRAWRVTAS
jgi:hypothetical protein